MPFKLNISNKGKAWKLETTSEVFVGKKIGDAVQGAEIDQTLEGYELVITGATDSSGFPHKKDVEGPNIKRVILTRGWGMHEKHEGLRKRKTIRGSQLSEKTAQINLSVVKVGTTALEQLFPEQNKAKEEPKAEEQAPVAA